MGEDGAIADSVLRVFPHQAEAGVHYVAFDDERMAEHLTWSPESWRPKFR